MEMYKISYYIKRETTDKDWEYVELVYTTMKEVEDHLNKFTPAQTILNFVIMPWSINHKTGKKGRNTTAWKPKQYNGKP